MSEDSTNAGTNWAGHQKRTPDDYRKSSDTVANAVVPVTEESSPHVSAVVDARAFLLQGDPRQARDRLAPFIGLEAPTDANGFHAAMRAALLYSDASLEIGTPQTIEEAIDTTQTALNDYEDSTLIGKEPLYFVALYATYAESLRRADRLDAEVIAALDKLLMLIDALPDIRYKAVQYIGYRTLGLQQHGLSPAEKKSQPELICRVRKAIEYLGYQALGLPLQSPPLERRGDVDFLHLARVARLSFLANTDATVRDATARAAKDEDKLLQPNRSALLSALISFPYF